MSSARDRFLQTVRRAVVEGNRAGQVPPHPERGDVGYQGAGADALARFCEECTSAGGQPHVVPDRTAAVAKVLELVKASGGRRVLLGRGAGEVVAASGSLAGFCAASASKRAACGYWCGAVVDALCLAESLGAAGIDVADQNRATFFAADIGITGVDYLVAETGSIVLCTRPEQPRSASLLPPVYIAVAGRDQILPDLFDLFRLQMGSEVDGVPACLSLITGPSKTGDIELKLVTGVHGPGKVHVVVIDAVGG